MFSIRVIDLAPRFLQQLHKVSNLNQANQKFES